MSVLVDSYKPKVTERYIKLKPLQWFEENAYKDDDELIWFWVNEAEFQKWERGDKTFTPAIPILNINNKFFIFLSNNPNRIEDFEWGAERELFKDVDSEYFI